MTNDDFRARQVNLRALYRYNFFNSLALSVVASTILSDILLLRMGFRTEQFAYARSAMFIAPALCYELLAGYLQAKNRDRLVCIWSYALRVTVPLLLPVMALCTANRSVLFWTAIFVFGFGFTMAAFANNTLSILYRKLLPAEEFSRYSARLFLLWNMPSNIGALLVARLLDHCADLSNRAFFLLVTALELVTLLFEIPAIASLCRLKADGPACPYHPSLRESLAPILDKDYRKILLMKVLHGALIGLIGSFMAVCFLIEARFSAFSFMLTVASMSFAGMGLSVFFGFDFF